MKKIKSLYPLFIWLLIASFAACDNDDEDLQVLLPSNLDFTITTDTSSARTISVTATATKANFYSYTFNENGASTWKESPDGSISFQFTEDGIHQIVVRAHATHDHYIEQVESVTITTDQPGNDGAIPTSGYSTPLSYPNLTLVWNDEFDGTDLNMLDWNFEIGTGNNGWGNNELQYYLQENTTVANGVLTIEAKTQLQSGSAYTSSRITTQGKQTFQYGRIDIRAAMPYGQGLWPALWMLGESFATDGWPQCGEIDIMEMVGGVTTSDRGDAVCHGTVHWDNGGSYANFGGSTKLSSGTLADEFHVYSIIWDNQKIDWYLDDQKYHSIDITPANLSEFNQKFFFIFNVAVGGNWPGSPDNSTSFPQKMFVDYVRVFQ